MQVDQDPREIRRRAGRGGEPRRLIDAAATGPTAAMPVTLRRRAATSSRLERRARRRPVVEHQQVAPDPVDLPSATDDGDRASRTRSAGEAGISGHEGNLQPLGDGDVAGIVGGEAVAQLPDANEQTGHSNAP